ncbi:unnamed protein product [Protopolystoma xenopodis]|uniref:Uncharacterized protein n=1 Tax=Protopolystoma xenopodis TaxID=117903 RepID=A0A448WDK7_9PLAT|nr:unnamed protein product [Protopolystoma xenopodis]
MEGRRFSKALLSIIKCSTYPSATRRFQRFNIFCLFATPVTADNNGVLVYFDHVEAPGKEIPSHQVTINKYVDPSTLASQVESALSNGNPAAAESLVLAALGCLRHGVSGGSLGGSLALVTGTASSLSSTGLRLSPAISFGLLSLARSHPSLFSRPAVLDYLLNLLSLTTRDFGGGLVGQPLQAAFATLAVRARGLLVFVANILLLALQDQTKWPTRLIKIYLDDSLSDRIWVDREECRAFVLNLETAFPEVRGDPRGLFTLLCSSGSNASLLVPTGTNSSVGMISSSSTSVGSCATAFGGQNLSSINPAHVVLGLVPTSVRNQSNEPIDGLKTAAQDIEEAVLHMLGTQGAHTSKIVHSGDPKRLVQPRFETCRQAVNVIIVNTLRDALGRRGLVGGAASGSSSSGGCTGASVQSTAGSIPGSNSTMHSGPSASSICSGSGQMSSTVSTTTLGSCSISASSSIAGGTAASVTSVGSGAVSGGGGKDTSSGGSGEIVHLRGLIRTLALAAGIPEIRGLIATRLEPWLTASSFIFIFYLVYLNLCWLFFNTSFL